MLIEDARGSVEAVKVIETPGDKIGHREPSEGQKRDHRKSARRVFTGLRGALLRTRKGSQPKSTELTRGSLN
jgi:hypothetical protein